MISRGFSALFIQLGGPLRTLRVEDALAARAEKRVDFATRHNDNVVPETIGDRARLPRPQTIQPLVGKSVGRRPMVCGHPDTSTL